MVITQCANKTARYLIASISMKCVCAVHTLYDCTFMSLCTCGDIACTIAMSVFL